MIYESQYYGAIEISDYCLMHHGIKGQKWGTKNGPPYPLDGEDHSSREKRLNWRSSLNKKISSAKSHGISANKKNKVKSDKRFQLSSKQKTAIKIGAAVAVAGLAVYGGYKLSKMNAGQGQKNLKILDDYLKNAKNPVIEIESRLSNVKGKLSTKINGEPLPDISTNETILERMTKINPNHYEDNCLPSAIAGQARLMGKNVTAQGLNSGNRLPMDKAIKKCFKNAEVLTDNPSNRVLASQFAKSKKDASDLLRSKFGDNASGVVGINWTKEMGGGGHAFNFQIINGNVIFSDYQNSFTNSNRTLNNFWDMNAIASDKYICIARCDNATFGKTIRKFVSNAA